MREVVKMNDLGLLGPDLVLVHMYFTGEDEMGHARGCGRARFVHA